MNKFLKTCLALASAAAALVLALAAVLIGGYFYVAPSLPAAEELRDVRFQTPMRIYSRDGRLIQQFGEQKRTPVDYDDIPQVLIDALIAAEDDRFFDHPGIDYTGILKGAFNFVLAAGGERVAGGSTITQQVARDYFLSREYSLVRKFKEWILALQIERELDKREILELFCNTTFFGHHSFGVVAAAHTYFGKALDELTLAEIAVIAGIPQGPSIMNPVSSVENAHRRREYVLRRMSVVGYINEAERRAALAEPIPSRRHGLEVELEAPYVAEMVRREMLRRFGPAAYTAGLTVTATIDSRLQRSANRAVRSTLIGYDERHGYRGPVANVDLDSLEEAAAGEPPDWELVLAAYPDVVDFETGLVLEAAETEAVVYLRNGGRRTIGLDAVVWAAPYLNVNAVGARPDAVSDVLSRGDIVRFRHVDGGVRLVQLPEAQGAFVALDPDDGAIVSLAGGFDYFLSNFNSATQALRQPGSSFKPFMYSAALENGYTAASIINDSPLSIASEELETVWRPENYEGISHGFTRLREALVHSYNRAAIRTLQSVGLDPAIRHIAKFGFAGGALPRELGLALGAVNLAPIELVTGYAVFANGGFGVDHYFIDRIENADGEEIYRASPRVVCRRIPRQEPVLPEAVAGSVDIGSPSAACETPEEDARRDKKPELINGVTELYPEIRSAERVIGAQNAYLMADMMGDVVRRGSGARAYRELRRDDLSGKTGTTNDRRDAWFAGFNRDIVAAAWVGFPDNRPLGIREQGGVTAIPMWIDFMREALAGQPESRLEQPPGIVEVRIDKETGRAVGGARPNTIFEKFRIGHVPEREPGRDSGDSSSSGGGSDDRLF